MRPLLIALGVLLGAAAGVGLAVAVAAFTTWGFDPATWEPIDRCMFALMAIGSGLMGAVGGLSAADLWLED